MGFALGGIGKGQREHAARQTRHHQQDVPVRRKPPEGLWAEAQRSALHGDGEGEGQDGAHPERDGHQRREGQLRTAGESRWTRTKRLGNKDAGKRPNFPIGFPRHPPPHTYFATGTFRGGQTSHKKTGGIWSVHFGVWNAKSQTRHPEDHFEAFLLPNIANFFCEKLTLNFSHHYFSKIEKSLSQSPVIFPIIFVARTVIWSRLLIQGAHYPQLSIVSSLYYLTLRNAAGPPWGPVARGFQLVL